MNEKIKRKKDQGFTLIELMIVIAVIGILAVVLVPKVGAIKSQAKSAGVATNVRTVEAYCQSKVNEWATAGSANTVVQDDIASAFTTNTITNPVSLAKTVGTDTVADTNALQVLTAAVATIPKGGVVVVVTGTGSSLSISITGYDAAATAGTPVTVTP